MPIYTGTGDQGKTSLLSGERLQKHHPRLETSGAIDELNSMIGVVMAHLNRENPDDKAALGEMARIQADLFVIGAWFSTTSDAPERAQLQSFPADGHRWLETAIDRMTADLPAFTHFILPGGHSSAAFSHVARTLCRRAERQAVALLDTEQERGDEPLQPMLVYLNRLSDYLFVLARWCNFSRDVAETPWRPQV
jgi:cob(I)alamin adenosyltransferase